MAPSKNSSVPTLNNQGTPHPREVLRIFNVRSPKWNPQCSLRTSSRQPVIGVNSQTPHPSLTVGTTCRTSRQPHENNITESIDSPGPDENFVWCSVVELSIDAPAINLTARQRCARNAVSGYDLSNFGREKPTFTPHIDTNQVRFYKTFDFRTVE
jgi:hypothetical protein